MQRRALSFGGAMGAAGILKNSYRLSHGAFVSHAESRTLAVSYE
jgi:hypothetical protein